MEKGDTYADFTLEQYGAATVVFDGNQLSHSAKDNEHQRREQKINFPGVNFTIETVFEGIQEEFISKGSNKQQLINLTSYELRKMGCTAIQADGDAEVDIAKAAVTSARTHSTMLIGEDTDLSILIL